MKCTNYPYLLGQLFLSLLLVSSASVLLSCSTLNYLQAGNIQTAVRIATVLYIDNDPEKAADVLYVITETRKDIDKYEEISIAKATDYVRKNIVWTKLEPLEAIAAEAVISRIGAAINNEITHAQISPDKIVLVHNVLDWIEEAILLSRLTTKPDTQPLVDWSVRPDSTTTTNGWWDTATNDVVETNTLTN